MAALSAVKQYARTVKVPRLLSRATSSLPMRPEADVKRTIGFDMERVRMWEGAVVRLKSVLVVWTLLDEQY